MTALGASGDALLIVDARMQSGARDEFNGQSNSLTLLLPDELCAELTSAVEKAAVRSAGSINALQLAVRRFTVALRDNGAKPEDVLIAIKSVIHAHTFTLVDARHGWRPDELPQQISTWSIQEFFKEKQA